MAMEPSKYAYNVYIFYNSKDKTPSNIGHFINLKRLNVSHEKKLKSKLFVNGHYFLEIPILALSLKIVI